MNKLIQTLMLGGSTFAVIATGSAAWAQTPATDTDVESVVVTGTNIRGTPPIGVNVITVSPQDIEAIGAQQTSQIFADVPALNRFGNTGQTGDTHNGASTFFSPAIHQLGESASNNTLVLVDGHRVPMGGTNHTTVNANMIAPSMIERVDVLADGASATYGSDAVAGVINIITRRKFDGIEGNAQTTFVQGGAMDWTASVLTGKSWDDGSLLVDYTYTVQGGVPVTDNPRASQPNKSLVVPGGTNFNTFNCAPATIQMGSSGPVYLNPTSGLTVPSTATINAPCNTAVYGDLAPDSARSNVMMKIQQDLSSRVKLSADVVYMHSVDRAPDQDPGSVTATVYGPDSGKTGQINPFYVTPVGYTGPATSETVRFNFRDLLGNVPNPYGTTYGEDTFYGHFNTDWNVDDNFVVTLMGAGGRDDSYTNSLGGLVNSSVALLALNGTTNAGGSTTAISVPASGITALNLPLTAANALDVWHSGAANQTSAAVIQKLKDNASTNHQVDGYEQLQLSVNGTVFKLPGGDVKIAAGVEAVNYQLTELTNQANNSGIASAGSLARQYSFGREVHSGFVETNVPVISPEMGVPLMQKLVVNLAVRYDHYSDFGSTTNPKIAATWTIIDGLSLRASYDTSFVAPTLDVVGLPGGVYDQSGYGSTTNSISVSTSAYPGVTSILPGCVGHSLCDISTLTGIMITNGNHQMQPQRGRDWTAGIDIGSELLEGFNANITLWHDTLQGGITTPAIGLATQVGALNHLLTFYPGGATAAQIAAALPSPLIPQTSTLPSTVSYIFDYFNGNYVNLKVLGLDAAFSYIYDFGDWGSVTVGDGLTLNLSSNQFYPGGAVYSTLNTVGTNAVFPNVAVQSRAHISWDWDNIQAEVYANYVGSYWNRAGGTINPVNKDSQGNPTSGGDRVAASTTFDVHLAYNFQTGILGDDQVYLNANDVFNWYPPFVNSAQGMANGNILGRLVTIGLRAKL